MPRLQTPFAVFICCFICCFILAITAKSAHAQRLRVGAAIVDISPTQMPVIVNGGVLSRTADQIRTTINARAIVADDGKDRVAIVVVDSCMVPRELLDDAKARAAKQTKLRADHICISATHTHTAPSAFGALGTPADQSYLPLLREKLVQAIVAAEKSLQPAQIGWGTINAPEFTALRRWVRRPDRIEVDPFGNRTVRANMHSAKNLDNVTGESGPEDPELSMIAFRSTDGKPIAILCNFSMHYFSDKPISADYFGLFSDKLAEYAASLHEETDASDVVGVMSHGCSGDIWRRDYMTWGGKDTITDIDEYAQGLVDVAKQAYDAIEYKSTADIGMAESRLPLRYRLPDEQRLKWANEIVANIQDDTPKDRTEVYAREQVLLNEMQRTTVCLQAIKLGDIGIATTPCETYALTGLKLKNQSPLKHTMVIELANGADGYIPPPEQHRLGGYNTWAARSAGLEIFAEHKIVATDLDLLEQVSGKPRRAYKQTAGKQATNILNRKPIAYWRLDEMKMPVAIDSSGNGNHGVCDPGVLFFLPGPSDDWTDETQTNRAVHLAGGRIRGQIQQLTGDYTIEMSIWNGMPNNARPTTAWFFSQDHPDAVSQSGLHVGIGGTDTKPGRLIAKIGDRKIVVGNRELARWQWYRVRIERADQALTVSVIDEDEPEIKTDLDKTTARMPTAYFGGRCDNESNLEGRIDEIAVFNP